MNTLPIVLTIAALVIAGLSVLFLRGAAAASTPVVVGSTTVIVERPVLKLNASQAAAVEARGIGYKDRNGTQRFHAVLVGVERGIAQLRVGHPNNRTFRRPMSALQF